MADLQNQPMEEEPKTIVSFMKLNIDLLYIQGLWSEIYEDDLEFYKNFFPRRLGVLVERFPLLLHLLRGYRKFYPYFLIGFGFLQGILFDIVGMYVYRDNKEDFVKNGFSLFVCVIIVAASGTIYFIKEECKIIIKCANESIKTFDMDNAEQTAMFHKTNVICLSMTKYVNMGVLVCFLVLFPTHSIVNLLPNRILFYKEWYPYDVTVSPAYEITLFVRTVYIMLAAFSISTLVTFLAIILLNMRAFSQILNFKLVNIRDIAMSKILKRKQNETYAKKNAKTKRLRKVQLLKLVKNTPNASIPLLHSDYSVKEVDKGTGNVPYIKSQLSVENKNEEKCTFNTPSLLDDNKYVSARQRSLNTSSGRNQTKGVKVKSAKKGSWKSPNVCSETQGVNGKRAQKKRSLNTLTPLTQRVSVNDCVVYTIPLKDSRKLGRPESVANNKETKITNPNIKWCTTLSGIRGMTVEELDAEMVYQLSKNIQMHQTLMQIVGDLAKICDIIFVVLSISNIIGFGGIMLILTKTEEFDFIDVFMTILFVVTSSLFLVINVVINLITDEFTGIVFSMYSCDWFRTSLKFKRLMLVIMTQATRPLNVKPTGFDPLSVKMFGEVAKMAYNMFTTFQNIMK